MSPLIPPPLVAALLAGLAQLIAWLTGLGSISIPAQGALASVVGLCGILLVFSGAFSFRKKGDDHQPTPVR